MDWNANRTDHRHNIEHCDGCLGRLDGNSDHKHGEGILWGLGSGAVIWFVFVLAFCAYSICARQTGITWQGLYDISVTATNNVNWKFMWAPFEETTYLDVLDQTEPHDIIFLITALAI